MNAHVEKDRYQKYWGKRDMSEFSVDTKSLFEAAADLNKLFYQCDSIVQEMDQIISCFHYQINSDGYDNEINCLIIQSANLKNSRENLASAANTLQKIAECYEEVAVPQSFWAEWKENCEKKFPDKYQKCFYRKNRKRYELAGRNDKYLDSYSKNRRGKCFLHVGFYGTC